MHALNGFRLAAAAVLVVLSSCGSGPGGGNSFVRFGISGAVIGATAVAVELTGGAGRTTSGPWEKAVPSSSAVRDPGGGRAAGGADRRGRPGEPSPPEVRPRQRPVCSSIRRTSA